MTDLDRILKSRDTTLLTEVHVVKTMVFPVVMYGCESRTIKAERQRTDAFKLWCLEKTLESLLDCKEIKRVNPKGNQSWILTGRIEAEVEAPILWPPDVKSRLIRKDPDAEKYWRQEEKGTTEDEMVGWHHWPNGHKFRQALGVGEGQGSLFHADHGVAESDMTEKLNIFNTRVHINVSLKSKCFTSNTHMLLGWTIPHLWALTGNRTYSTETTLDLGLH